MTFPDNFDEKDKPDPALAESQKAVAELLGNPSRLRNLILAFLMMPFLFVTGAGALGTFVMSRINQEFFKDAIPVEATVLKRSTESYKERVTRQTANGTTADYVTRTTSVFDLSFTTQDGKKVAAKLKIPDSKPLPEDTRVMVVSYRPENPQDVRLTSQRADTRMLSDVSSWLFYAFLTLAVIFYFLTRGRKRT